MKKAYVLLLTYTLVGNFAMASQPAQAVSTDYVLAHAPSGAGIWRLNPAGTTATQLSDFGWYADAGRGGGKIVFSNDYNAGIWIMDADGNNKRRLTTEGREPSLSPDGSRIVFVKCPQNTPDCRLWIVNSDGTGERLLTTTPALSPDWSNFSDRIAFGSVGGGIYTINADGSDETLVINYGESPAWWYNDTVIVFSAGSIYRVTLDGSSVHLLSPTQGTAPTVGPGGIIFETTSGLVRVVSRGNEYLWNTELLGPSWVADDINPPYPPGPVFSGIGLIPATEIVDGYATTAPGYYLQVENAPFGGVLHVFGNFPNARAEQIALYTVEVGIWQNATTPPAATDYVQLQESWGNYLWDNALGKYVYQNCSPDSLGRYPVPPVTENWYLDDLLIQWDTRNHGDGKYSILLQGYDANGVLVPSNFSGTQLEVVLDNTKPLASIDQILHQGKQIDECAVSQLGFQDPLEFVITAMDNFGHLRRYVLDGFWGNNHHFDIEQENYSAATHGSSWVGVQNATAVHADWPAQCAYDFRLRVYDRAINGYTHVNWATYHKLVTLLPQ